MAQIEPITWFRNAHPEQGSLRVQVSAAQGIFPIPGASVEVYRDFGAVRETFGHGGHQRHRLHRGGEPPGLPLSGAPAGAGVSPY